MCVCVCVCVCVSVCMCLCSQPDDGGNLSELYGHGSLTSHKRDCLPTEAFDISDAAAALATGAVGSMVTDLPGAVQRLSSCSPSSPRSRLAHAVSAYTRPSPRPEMVTADKPESVANVDAEEIGTRRPGAWY